ncbi:MAG: phosphonate ABC transporter ATP-binding protein [Candidatus Metalachnospira sp.]|nr:phosphonate ABC transporter ATP-binding protein [Candidatus Metalachnospira sp.]
MIEIKDLKKNYILNNKKTFALNGISLKLPEGKFISVIGPSGAGKSTLLRSINGMIKADSGSIIIDGKDITQLKGKKKREIQKNICMIFQDFCLVKSSTVIKNVLNACLSDMNVFSVIFGLFGIENKRNAEKILERVGMADKMYQPAESLSGGEQQRVAIARAIMQGGKILLADEPVASLDPVNANDVLNLLKSLQLEKNMTVIMNSHNVEQALKYSDWIIGLNSGHIVYQNSPQMLTDQVKEIIYRKDNGNGQSRK